MQTEDINGKTLEIWTSGEVHAALEANEVILIDVRTPAEYTLEHVEGALLMPLSFFAPRAIPTDASRQVVFHCGSGVRSEKVARIMLDAGENRIAHMGGGFGGWKDAGLPYMGTDMASGAPKRMP